MRRREFLTRVLAGTSLLRLRWAPAQESSGGIFLERAAPGAPHKGKVLLAVQAHSDDVPLEAAGTVAKLIEEGYTRLPGPRHQRRYGRCPWPRHTRDDRRERARQRARQRQGRAVLGCEKHFDLNYSNHRMADVSLNELVCRLIFLIRLLKVDTVVCWDPWAHDEENPDHYMVARAVEAACWMAGRDHDYPEQFAAGLAPKTVQDKYYFARRPEITRVVDISGADRQQGGGQPRQSGEGAGRPSWI